MSMEDDILESEGTERSKVFDKEERKFFVWRTVVYADVFAPYLILAIATLLLFGSLFKPELREDRLWNTSIGGLFGSSMTLMTQRKKQ